MEVGEEQAEKLAQRVFSVKEVEKLSEVEADVTLSYI